MIPTGLGGQRIQNGAQLLKCQSWGWTYLMWGRYCFWNIHCQPIFSRHLSLCTVTVMSPWLSRCRDGTAHSCSIQSLAICIYFLKFLLILLGRTVEVTCHGLYHLLEISCHQQKISGFFFWKMEVVYPRLCSGDRKVLFTTKRPSVR
jgi:hypothetical protein